jgi:hypothetical protein
MDVCLLWVLCGLREGSLRRADHSSIGVLPTVMCLSVFVKPRNEVALAAEGLLHLGGMGGSYFIHPNFKTIYEQIHLLYN